MKFCVAIFAIGDIFYKEYSIPVLEDYFTRHNIDYRFIDRVEGGLRAHPSWLKLLVYKIIPDYDYIICMDLDLLPKNPDVSFIDDFDFSKLSMCVDTGVKHNADENFSEIYRRNFRYNGGLIGIPKKMAEFMEGVYDKHAPGKYPSYEQYYLNNEIVKQGIEIHELPDDLNCLFSYPEFKNARLQHYTSKPAAKSFIESHCENYFRKVAHK